MDKLMKREPSESDKVTHQLAVKDLEMQMKHENNVMNKFGIYDSSSEDEAEKAYKSKK